MPGAVGPGERTGVGWLPAGRDPAGLADGPTIGMGEPIRGLVPPRKILDRLGEDVNDLGMRGLRDALSRFAELEASNDVIGVAVAALEAAFWICAIDEHDGGKTYTGIIGGLRAVRNAGTHELVIVHEYEDLEGLSVPLTFPLRFTGPEYRWRPRSEVPAIENTKNTKNTTTADAYEEHLAGRQVGTTLRSAAGEVGLKGV